MPHVLLEPLSILSRRYAIHVLHFALLAHSQIIRFNAQPVKQIYYSHLHLCLNVFQIARLLKLLVLAMYIKSTQLIAIINVLQDTDLTILIKTNANFVQQVTTALNVCLDLKTVQSDVINVTQTHSGSGLMLTVFLSVLQRTNVTLLQTIAP